MKQKEKKAKRCPLMSSSFAIAVTIFLIAHCTVCHRPFSGADLQSSNGLQTASTGHLVSVGARIGQVARTLDRARTHIHWLVVESPNRENGCPRMHRKSMSTTKSDRINSPTLTGLTGTGNGIEGDYQSKSFDSSDNDRALTHLTIAIHR